jgi:peptide/nickel transport system permease protein
MSIQAAGSNTLPRRRSATRRRFRLRLIPAVPLAFLILVVVLAIGAPLFSPHSPDSGRLLDSFLPPVWQDGGTWSHPLGTDANGRDVLSRLIYGARIPIIVVLFGVAITALVGTVVGLVAGYFGGIIDAISMRLVDTMLSIPPILLAIALIGVLGPNLRNVILVITITSWAPYARVIRGEALRIRTADHVNLARVAGCGTFRIIYKHVFPEVTNTLIVLATLSIATMILYEAALSFLGLGVRPPAASWGGMLSEGRLHMNNAWWLTVIPGVALLLTCVSANLLGDWLRDRLDPRLQNVGP